MGRIGIIGFIGIIGGIGRVDWGECGDWVEKWGNYDYICR